MKSLTLILALILIVPSAWSTDDSRPTLAGHVDFSKLSQSYGEPRVTVNLGASLLHLIGAIKHDDPVIEETLKNLDSVRIRVYDTAGDIGLATAQMDTAGRELGDLDWERIVRVTEPEERINVYVKHSQTRIHGLVIMAIDAEEAVFVNVSGDINPAHLNDVVAGIAVVDDFNVDLEL